MLRKEELVKIYRDTVTHCKRNTSGSYKQSELWSFDDLPPDSALTDELTELDQPAVVTVVNADTLTTANELVDEGLNPLVLNMASNICPGGGVKRGSRAQEEELFRRTNYDKCTNRKFYPIGNDQFIVTEDVTVVKDEAYNLLRDPFKLDFIAIAAIRQPALDYNTSNDQPQYMDDEDYKLMEQKIDAIFRYAAYQEKDSLVLGALGCGAFGNPCSRVANMFKEALERYRKYFVKITFAVLSLDRNPNYDAFKHLATS